MSPSARASSSQWRRSSLRHGRSARAPRARSSSSKGHHPTARHGRATIYGERMLWHIQVDTGRHPPTHHHRRRPVEAGSSRRTQGTSRHHGVPAASRRRELWPRPSRRRFLWSRRRKSSSVTRAALSVTAMICQVCRCAALRSLQHAARGSLRALGWAQAAEKAVARARCSLIARVGSLPRRREARDDWRLTLVSVGRTGGRTPRRRGRRWSFSIL